MHGGTIAVSAAAVRGRGRTRPTAGDQEDKPRYPGWEEAVDAVGERLLFVAPAYRVDRFRSIRCHRYRPLIFIHSLQQTRRGDEDAWERRERSADEQGFGVLGAVVRLTRTVVEGICEVTFDGLLTTHHFFRDRDGFLQHSSVTVAAAVGFNLVIVLSDLCEAETLPEDHLLRMEGLPASEERFLQGMLLTVVALEGENDLFFLIVDTLSILEIDKT